MNQVEVFFKKLFDSADWPARWHCGKWSDFHGWLYIISDLLIWSAYFTIPIVIVNYILKRKGIRFERLYFLFAGFILACGATHFLDAVAFWVPLYRLSALVRFITGVVSWATVFYVVKLLPVLFSLKSQDALEAEIRRRKQAEERFKTLLEAMPDALIIADGNGVITLVNHQTEKLFGYTKSALTGKPIDFLTAEPFKKAYTRFQKQFFSIPDSIVIEKKFDLCGLRQNGHEFPAEVHVSTIRLEDGLYLCATIRDASERKKQEKEINEMGVIIASSSDAIISKSLDGTVLTWNKGAEKILGYTYNEIKDSHISLILPPELLQEENMLIEKILGGGKVEQYETIRVRKNQARINVSITLSAIKNGAGKVVGISNILRDITQQKIAELELKESHERSKIFIQQAPNAIAMFDKKMRYLAASHRWIVDYKLEGKEIVNHSHYDIFPEVGDDWKAIHQACLQGEVNQCDEASFERADGAVQWLTWDVRPWYISENNIGGLIMYTSDITRIKEKDTERKRIEKILEISNNIARISTFEIEPKTEKITLSRIAHEIFELPENYKLNYETIKTF
ncbi:MAG: PAS domain S-box protein [Ferruginibacter sp.]